MSSKVYDWKEVAERYYEKAVTLSILILLFAFLVSPQIEVKPYERIETTIISVVPIPDLKDPVPPPTMLIKPDLKLVFDDSFNDENEELPIYETLPKTILNPYEIQDINIEGSTKIWQVFEDPPVPIKQVPPLYTELARNIGIEGIVELEVEIFADGSVGAVKVLRSLLSGPGGLDNEAIKAVKQWEFQPARSSGKPVAVWVTFPVEFNLE